MFSTELALDDQQRFSSLIGPAQDYLSSLIIDKSSLSDCMFTLFTHEMKCLNSSAGGVNNYSRRNVKHKS